MKRALVLTCLLTVTLALSFAVVTAVAGASREDSCYFVVAGPEATVDGSLLMGYTNDWAANNWMSLKTVAAGRTTHRFLKFRAKAASAEGGINDAQLGICFGTATDIDGTVLAADPYVKEGFGPEMWDRVLARCATASQAIDMLGLAMAGKGCSEAGAGALAVADPHEAWIFETLGGHHWAAARVPDDEIWAHVNGVGIREIDLSDPRRFRGSPDLEEFAISLGRYNPATESFDVAWAYNDRAELVAYYNANRLWGALHMFAPSLRLEPTTPWADLPGHFKPECKVTRQRIEALLRYHYEGTTLDESNHYRAMTPHAMNTRPLCARYSDYSVVTQLRAWLPNDVGGVAWVSLSRPCASTFVPFYVAAKELPAAWSDTTAFDAFRAVAMRLDRRDTEGRTRDYARYIPLVRGAYGVLERRPPYGPEVYRGRRPASPEGRAGCFPRPVLKRCGRQSARSGTLASAADGVGRPRKPERSAQVWRRRRDVRSRRT